MQRNDRPSVGTTVGNMGNTKVRDHALRAGILGGIVGVLLDIDHPIAYWLGWNWDGAGRFLHFPVVVACICLLVIAYSHLGRLHRTTFLSNTAGRSKK